MSAGADTLSSFAYILGCISHFEVGCNLKRNGRQCVNANVRQNRKGIILQRGKNYAAGSPRSDTKINEHRNVGSEKRKTSTIVGDDSCPQMVDMAALDNRVLPAF